MGFQCRWFEGKLRTMSCTAPKIAANNAKDEQHLLLVEDNPVFAAQLSDAVAQIPGRWSVFHCPTGQMALDAIAHPDAQYDLALIDVGLPDMSGVEVISGCRDRFADMPIVVISVITAELSVLNAIRAGANGYILKSHSVQKIAQDVAQVLEGIYPLSPQLARFLFKQLAMPAEKNTKNLDDFNLTPREVETLQYLAQGNSYEQVASLMGVALSTVQSNIRNLYRKLNVRSQAQAVSMAHTLKLI